MLFFPASQRSLGPGPQAQGIQIRNGPCMTLPILVWVADQTRGSRWGMTSVDATGAVVRPILFDDIPPARLPLSPQTTPRYGINMIILCYNAALTLYAQMCDGEMTADLTQERIAHYSTIGSGRGEAGEPGQLLSAHWQVPRAR